MTAGTIFHGSRLVAGSWFAAIWYVVHQERGLSALAPAARAGFGSYQTPRAWLHKLRRAMVCPGRDPLDGTAEIDESLVGAVKPGGRGRSPQGKGLVVIALECREGGPGRVRMRQIPNAAADTWTDFVLDNVARRAAVHTDGWAGYNDIGRHRFRHMVINLSASADPAHVVMPEVHRVASLLKCWLLVAPGRAA